MGPGLPRDIMELPDISKIYTKLISEPDSITNDMLELVIQIFFQWHNIIPEIVWQTKLEKLSFNESMDIRKFTLEFLRLAKLAHPNINNPDTFHMGRYRAKLPANIQTSGKYPN